MTAPLLVIGEALVDIVAPAPRTTRNGNGKGKATPGGFAANVAVGLARLGVPTELVARFGTDPYGDQLGAHLFGNGVQLAPGSVDPGFRTSTATATLDAAGVASYQFDITWDPPALSLTRGCPAIHTGSIATMLEPGATAIRELPAVGRGATGHGDARPERPAVDHPGPGGDVGRRTGAGRAGRPGEAERRGLRVPAARAWHRTRSRPSCWPSSGPSAW